MGVKTSAAATAFSAQILLLVPLGAYVPQAGGRHGEAFATHGRIGLPVAGVLWWRISRVDTPEFARPTNLYVAVTFAFAVGFAASIPLSASGRLILWAILGAVYLTSVGLVFEFVPGRLAEAITVTDSLTERFGLLVIIVLGETVTGVVSGLTDRSDERSQARGRHRLRSAGLRCVVDLLRLRRTTVTARQPPACSSG